MRDFILKTMKTFLSYVSLFLFIPFVSGQIIPEATYNHSGTYTKLAVSGDKFFLMDVIANQCRIYNTDHSLWKTINLSVPANNYLYDIRYVSENLFTLDNSVCLIYIYYSYDAVGQYYTYTAKIIREDGTVLLTIPGCQYVYVHRLSNNRCKLTAYSFDYSLYPYKVQTLVYDLPGQLITFSSELNQAPDFEALAFPNPASSFLTIPLELPDGIDNAQVLIYNSSGVVVGSYKVDRNTSVITIDTFKYPRGQYSYIITTGKYSLPAKKFILH